MSFLASWKGAVLAALLAQPALAWNTEYPQCPSYFTPFDYVGCYNDPDGTALPFRSNVISDNMTVETCQAICKGNNFRYAALKYYGDCYCGNVLNAKPADEAQCDHACRGNLAQTCGGDNELSVYIDPTFAKGNINIANYTSKGCFSDLTKGKRALAFQIDLPFDEMTPDLCLNSCSKQGLPLAGLEHGGECWCGTILHADSIMVPFGQCDTPCTGDLDLLCGAANRLQLWEAKSFKSSRPCGTEKPPATTVVGSTTSTPQPTGTTQTQKTDTYTGTGPGSDMSTKPGSTFVTSTTAPGTTQPPVTTTKYETTKTTTAPGVCTTVIPSDHYCCGDWCSSPLPDWDDQNSCTKARAQCRLESAACFKSAGAGKAWQCFDYVRWCKAVERYCGNECDHKKGSCSKHHCLRKNPPKGGSPPVPKTVPCNTPPPSTPPPATGTAPPPTTIPEPTNACIQPTDDDYDYGPGNPVGGIDLPIVACNNEQNDHKRGNHFKCYTEKHWSQCPSFERKDLYKACSLACIEQYDQCIAVYANLNQDGGKGGNKVRRDGGGHGGGPDGDRHEGDRRDGDRRDGDRRGGDGPGHGPGDKEDEDLKKRKRRCKVQYADCLGENRRADPGQKCIRYGSS